MSEPRRSRILAAFLVATSALAGTAAAESPNHARQFGLSESLLGRGDLGTAVGGLNRLLEADRDWRQFRLRPSWQPVAETADARIPVYLIDDTNLAVQETAFVPRRCRCIFVNRRGVLAFAAAYGDEANGLTKIDIVRLYQVLLLHEVGHVKHGHEGSSGFGDPRQRRSLNLDPSDVKNQEVEADRFVGDVLRKTSAPGGDFNRFMEASWIAVAIQKLSGNMQKIRLIDNFGGTAANAKYLFWDSGYSHPNLEFRMIVLNNLILQTGDSKALLDDFIARRAAAGRPVWRKD